MLKHGSNNVLLDNVGWVKRIIMIKDTIAKRSTVAQPSIAINLGTPQEVRARPAKCFKSDNCARRAACFGRFSQLPKYCA